MTHSPGTVAHMKNIIKSKDLRISVLEETLGIVADEIKSDRLKISTFARLAIMVAMPKKRKKKCVK